ncbi:uncharacterized protein LTHEOB_11898 [Neofusicoccum parvum]|uniref:Uncharacterized protein LTHEOB_11898 n=1 Tax=Neofusicoccum parvum TaxID=310453 RepID=A0ACB5SJN4_9PEZI|nr:uncharacterized protein LTHEOB_11898 [Neofusicoccum parvum]
MPLLKKPIESEKSPRDSIVSSGSHSSAGAPPPAYHEQPPSDALPSLDGANLPPDFTRRLESLSLDPLRVQDAPAPDECIVHLKLLEAFYNLRQDIEGTEGLFGIAGPHLPSKNEKQERSDLKDHEDLDENTKQKIKQVREKRWAVYVSRAVDRYETWFGERIPKTTAGKMKGPITGQSLKEDPSLREEASTMGERLKDFFPENLPPLDVLMVWHAHTLNPRIFFEDCLRYGCLDFWATGIPWVDINACIDNTTFDYDVDEVAKLNWRRGAQLSWDNLDDPLEKKLRCPVCVNGTSLSIPWSRNAGFPSELYSNFHPGDGYADSNFVEVCRGCQNSITHDTLQVSQFRKDISRLLKEDVPLAGTVLDRQGRPIHPMKRFTNPPYFFASAWIKGAAHVKLLEATDLHKNPRASLDSVRLILGDALKKRKTVSQYTQGRGGNTLDRERMSIRRMMSRYWNNHTVFSIDLVGAVIRQGTFIEKMHNIGWIFSPTVYATAERLIQKYQNFFSIMAAYPRKMVVPTLDVDLAWHTHQTTPSRYFQFSETACNGVFIDHDDKIEEAKLDESFEWTSKQYQRMFGQPYSDRLFRTSNAAATSQLHESNSAPPSDPACGPHVSSHNSVRTKNSYAWGAARRSHLEKAYAAAVRRARKEGREPPQRETFYAAHAEEHSDKKKKEKDNGAYPYAMCAPYVGYAYGPYPLGGVGYAGGDPGYGETGTGVSGGCCQGTCGGMVGAGGSVFKLVL